MARRKRRRLGGRCPSRMSLSPVVARSVLFVGVGGAWRARREAASSLACIRRWPRSPARMLRSVRKLSGAAHGGFPLFWPAFPQR